MTSALDYSNSRHVGRNELPGRVSSARRRQWKRREWEGAIVSFQQVAPSHISESDSSRHARKTQNRIAQREFRLRKQASIRDLEAKVQVLEGDKEERVELMTLLIRNLLKENKELRNMVKSMASFIGEGLGSCLPRLGLSSNQLDAILNRADTDTAYEAFVSLKASRELQDANPGIRIGAPKGRSSASQKRKRTESAETPINVPTTSNVDPSSKEKDKGKTPQAQTSKKSKSTTDTPTPRNDYTYLFPDLDSMLMLTDCFDNPDLGRFNPSPLSGQIRTPTEIPIQGGLHLPFIPSQGSNNAPLYGLQSMSGTDLSGFGLTIPPNSMNGPLGNITGAAGFSANPQSPVSTLPTSSTTTPPPLHLSAGVFSNIPSASLPNNAKSNILPTNQRNEQLKQLAEQTISDLDAPGMTNEELAERRKAHKELFQAIKENNTSDRKMEAMQLIAYHLNNFRMNNEYHLPPSLCPTVIQRTVPHEHAIDGICFPSMRDRMILLRGRYDLVEVFHALLSELSLHGEDVLDERSYEVSEKFIHDYRQVDQH
nr:hypothetical protein L204_01213 [Cryptococcus depauperatus CBS 7855]